MADPWLSLAALAVVLAATPPPTLDPGPSAACPTDMRLVSGVHHDDMFHLCTKADPHGRQGLGANRRASTHCWGYAEGVSALEGRASDIRVCMDQYEAPNRRGARP